MCAAKRHQHGAPMSTVVIHITTDVGSRCEVHVGVAISRVSSNSVHSTK